MTQADHTTTSRVDLHCHSTASAIARLGVQGALGLPECATPQTDTFGQVVLEAQASGLPVVAVAAGGPAELIADGRSGLLCPPRPEALAGAVAGLASSRATRERLARGGLAAARERTWDAAMGRLAAGWQRALTGDAATPGRRAA